MGFTVGMLDSSVVFAREKDKGDSKSSTPLAQASAHQEHEDSMDTEMDHRSQDQQVTHLEAAGPPVRQHTSPRKSSNTANGNSLQMPLQYATASQSPQSNSTPSENHPLSAPISYIDSATIPHSLPNPPNTDGRAPWFTPNGLRTLGFIDNDIQEWDLDQLYNFEHFPLAGDVLNHSRRYVREYDESGNAFEGF